MSCGIVTVSSLAVHRASALCRWTRRSPTAGTLSTYRLSAPYEQSSPRRRATGLALALAVNVALLLALLTLGIIPTPGKKNSTALVVDLVAEGERSPAPAHQAEPKRQEQPVQHASPQRPTPKPPPIVLPVKPTIAAAATGAVADQLRAAPTWRPAILPMRPAPSREARETRRRSARAPNGELMYAAQWAREPTDAELGGYLPRNAPDGFGLIACKTIPSNRVDDCIELGQRSAPVRILRARCARPHGNSRVRPPRKNGHPLVGSWVRIRIDYPSGPGRGSAARLALRCAAIELVRQRLAMGVKARLTELMQ